MSELSSPIHTHTNQGFTSPLSSTISPVSVKSTPTHEQPSDDGQQDYTVLTMYSTLGDTQVTTSSHLSLSVSRKDAVDDEEYAQNLWSDPETTV